MLLHREPTPVVAHEERVDVPARVLAMRRTSSTLMGERVTTFDVISPVATLVRETRPRFVWKPLAPNAKYRVEIYENGQRVAESPELTASEWQSDRDLQRGHDYVWQVIATHAGTRAIAPRPPASEARFGIVDDAAFTRATRAESLDALHRAAAFAREGLLDDARRAFANVDPYTADPRLLAAVRTALE